MWLLNEVTFLYKIIHAWNFGRKDQVLIEHRDHKWQLLLYAISLCGALEKTYSIEASSMHACLSLEEYIGNVHQYCLF